MEISSSYNIYNVASTQSEPTFRKTSLTSDQKETLSNILSNYDSSKMTEEDQKSLFDSMMSAGIPMSDETASIMEAEGFSAPEKPQGPPPPPPPQGGDQSSQLSSIDDETKDTLLSLIDQYLSGEIDEDGLKEAASSLNLEDTVGNLLRAFA